MAVVSGGPHSAVVAALTKTGLLDLFDLVVTIEDVTAGKPAPDLYNLAVQRLAVPPYRCLAFEDTATGMSAAQAAWVPVVDIHRLQGGIEVAELAEVRADPLSGQVECSPRGLRSA